MHVHIYVCGLIYVCLGVLDVKKVENHSNSRHHLSFCYVIQMCENIQRESIELN